MLSTTATDQYVSCLAMVPEKFVNAHVGFRLDAGSVTEQDAVTSQDWRGVVWVKDIQDVEVLPEEFARRPHCFRIVIPDRYAAAVASVRKLCPD